MAFSAADIFQGSSNDHGFSKNNFKDILPILIFQDLNRGYFPNRAFLGILCREENKYFLTTFFVAEYQGRYE